MIRGLYTAAMGMVSGFFRQRVIASNLSNLNTVGYKQEGVVMQDFPAMLLSRLTPTDISSPAGGEGNAAVRIGRLGTGVAMAEAVIDFSQGSLRLTDSPLDIALEGSGFFRVQTPDGERYTRDGSFSRDAQGRLVTASGHFVLGQNGPVQLPEGDVGLDEQGNIFVDQNWVDRLNLAGFEQPETLRKVGTNLFAADGAQPVAADDTQVHQGYLEASNVNTVQATLDMMAVRRAYEASQRLVQLQDQVLSTTVSEVGRV